MKTLSIAIAFMLLSGNAFAGVLASEKDWVASEKFIDSVAQPGCVAETVFSPDEDNEFKLQVIMMKDLNGEYTCPFVMAFPSRTLSNAAFYEADAKTEKMNKSFSMTLLQPQGLPAEVVASRMDTSDEVISKIRQDYKFTVTFKSKNDVVFEANFSLAGSNKAITALFKQCKEY